MPAVLLQIARLDSDASTYAWLSFPALRQILVDLPQSWLAIGATWRGAPAGLALGYSHEGRFQLESLAVDRRLRGQGVGRHLMEALCALCRERELCGVDLGYAGSLGSRTALEALLAAMRFRPPHLFSVQLVGLAGAMASAGGAWAGVQRAPISGYDIHPWMACSEADGAAVQGLLDAAPELGTPDPRTAEFDAAVSLALRHKGILVGWLLGRRLTRSIGPGSFTADAVSFEYISARIADGCPRMLMLAMYHRAFSAQASIYGPASRIAYRTHPATGAMYAFTRRRFAPIALRLDETWRSSLDLH